MEDLWTLIEQDKYSEVFQKASEDYEKTHSKNALHYKALSSLLMKNYKSAFECYLSVLNEVESLYENNDYYKDNKCLNKSDGDFINVGVVHWLLGDLENAVKMFKDSMTLRFRYTNNYMIPPCIAFFAGVYLGDLKLVKEAKNHIKKGVRKKIPLGKYILDEINEDELLNEIKPTSPMRIRTLCKFEFYIAAKHLEHGDKEGFIEHLKKCRDIKGSYLEFEYFLAVGELDKLGT